MLAAKGDLAAAARQIALDDAQPFEGECLHRPGRRLFLHVAVPLGIALLSLMAVAPVLSWRAARPRVAAERLQVPVAVGTLLEATCKLISGKAANMQVVVEKKGDALSNSAIKAVQKS